MCFLDYGGRIWGSRLVVGALKRSSCGTDAMQALEVEGQTDQGPFASSLVQAAQRELAEVQDLLDDANHGFHRSRTVTVKRTSRPGESLSAIESEGPKMLVDQ